MQEHAQAFDSAQAAGAGFRKQGGFQGGVDDIGHRESAGGGEVHIQLRVVDHAERGRVDQERKIAEGGGAVFPGEGADARKSRGQARAAVGRAVAEGDGDPFIQQGGGDGTGGAAGAQNEGRAGGGVHAMGAKVGDETVAVGVVALDAGWGEDEGVDGAGAAGGGAQPVGEGEGGFLVGQGDIGAGETGISEGVDGVSEMLRGDGQRQVGAVDIVAR